MSPSGLSIKVSSILEWIIFGCVSDGKFRSRRRCDGIWRRMTLRAIRNCARVFIVRGCAWPLVSVTAALSSSRLLVSDTDARATCRSHHQQDDPCRKDPAITWCGSKVHQRWVPGIQSIGIPPLTMGNGPAGIGPTDVVQPHATAFPSPIAVAASWDRHDAWLYGASVADEMQAIGRTMLEAPTVNICRILGKRPHVRRLRRGSLPQRRNCSSQYQRHPESEHACKCETLCPE